MKSSPVSTIIDQSTTTEDALHSNFNCRQQPSKLSDGNPCDNRTRCNPSPGRWRTSRAPAAERKPGGWLARLICRYLVPHLTGTLRLQGQIHQQRSLPRQPRLRHRGTRLTWTTGSDSPGGFGFSKFYNILMPQIIQEGPPKADDRLEILFLPIDAETADPKAPFAAGGSPEFKLDVPMVSE